MRTKMVYDLPTRIFHWSFASLFVASFVIAKNVSDESVVFAFHMLSGFLLGFLVFWRIYWGIWGSKHSKFSSFVLHPKDLLNYGIGVLRSSEKRWTGHNPASSWSTVIMLLLAFGLASTGYLMGSGYKEQVEDIHELLADAFLIVVIMHVTGIVVHSFQHRDAIELSMWDGRKELDEKITPEQPKRNLAAMTLVTLIFAVSTYLLLSFDATRGNLSILGQTLNLGDWSSGAD